MPKIALERLNKNKSGKLNFSDEIFNPIYKDLKLDIEVGQTLYGNKTGDVKSLVDEEAILNSLRNLFSTYPGQKIYSPSYGLNLNQFLFEPLSEDIGELIGKTIYRGIRNFETRVAVENVNVFVNYNDGQYEVDVNVRIPTISKTKTFRVTNIFPKVG